MHLYCRQSFWLKLFSLACTEPRNPDLKILAATIPRTFNLMRIINIRELSVKLEKFMRCVVFLFDNITTTDGVENQTVSIIAQL